MKRAGRLASFPCFFLGEGRPPFHGPAVRAAKKGEQETNFMHFFPTNRWNC